MEETFNVKHKGIIERINRSENIVPFKRTEKGDFKSKDNFSYTKKLPQNSESIQDNIDFNFKSKGEKKTPLKVWENVDQLLKINNITVKYNNMSKEIEINNNKGNKSIEDNLVELNTLTLNNGLNIGIPDLYKFVKRIARINEYNPVAEYLTKCQSNWDGKSRVKGLCNSIKTNGDNEWKNFLITKWLVNAVHIAFNTRANEHNCEGILVIQGEQSMGKTRWIRSIIPKKEWLKTGITIDPANKDSVMKATKYWIVELGEMDATLKKEQAVLKQFFTENTDEYRAPYDVASCTYSRLTCFYATVNRIDFLKDDTGNRRYWTINASSIDVNHGIDLEQMWGEVMNLYTTKEVTTWLDDKGVSKLAITNEVSEVKSNIEVKILESFMWDEPVEKWEHFTSTEVADYINEKDASWTGRVIKKMMKTNLQITSGHGRKYKLPPKRTDFHTK